MYTIPHNVRATKKFEYNGLSIYPQKVDFALLASKPFSIHARFIEVAALWPGHLANGLLLWIGRLTALT